jgi:hypothetical protein
MLHRVERHMSLRIGHTLLSVFVLPQANMRCEVSLIQILQRLCKGEIGLWLEVLVMTLSWDILPKNGNDCPTPQKDRKGDSKLHPSRYFCVYGVEHLCPPQ